MKEISENPDEIIVTLYEGHYHYGVAALINSLVKAEFKGLILVGYRGDLPIWIEQLESYNTDSYIVNTNIVLKFQFIETRLHFGYYKPLFLKNTLCGYINASKIYYFDPDIIVNAPWQFFTEWVDSGICLCLDEGFHFVHENHPWRNNWRKLASADKNLKIDYYVNSGFIGLGRHHMLLLDRWIDLTNKYESIGGDITRWDQEGFKSFKGDQDLLNAAITISPEVQLSIIGTEGMGFNHPAYLMTHACTKVKPWKKNYLKALLITGNGPTFTEKNFFNHCIQPIMVFSMSSFRLKKLNLKITTVLNRIIGH